MDLACSFQDRSSSESLETPVVFVVDPDASLRESLASKTRSFGWTPKVVSATEDFFSESQCSAPCCLLIDLKRPDLFDAILQRPDLGRNCMPVIFMSRHVDARMIVQAMKAGAFEFLTKPITEEVLLSVVQEAIERSREALRRIARIRVIQERYESLSRREREVLNLIVSGRLNKQVGGELGISEITVKAHRGKMMRKMRAGSLAALVGMALSLNPTLVTPDA